MSVLVSEEMRSRGVAQVIVVLKQPNQDGTARGAALAGGLAATKAGSTPQQLSKHFTVSETSQTSAIISGQSTNPTFVSSRETTKRGKSAGGRERLGSRPRLKSLGTAPEAPPSARYYPNLGVLLGTVDKVGLAALRQDPRVAEVLGAPFLSLIRPQHVAAVRSTRSVGWGIEAMQVPQLWQQGITGAGVLVGHLDTGVDGTHPVFKNTDAIEHFAVFDDFGREVTPAPAPYDSGDHGTHTAATIAGRPVSGRHVGVAPGAQLASAMVIEGGEVVARVLGGMDWAVGLNVRILNMSLGFPGYWGDFLPLTQLLRSRNILPIFAVGNEGAGTSRSPGNYNEALSVGASDSQGYVADFSSSQRLVRPVNLLVPDLVAPGYDVISARPGGGYQSMSGTSMAAPHISGLAALLMEARPDRSVDEIEAAIFNSCVLTANMSTDRANRGTPDAVQALAQL